jgi:hypothetical protein
MLKRPFIFFYIVSLLTKCGLQCVVVIIPPNLFVMFECFIGTVKNNKVRRGFKLIWHSTLWLIKIKMMPVSFTSGHGTLEIVCPVSNIVSCWLGPLFQVSYIYFWCDLWLVETMALFSGSDVMIAFVVLSCSVSTPSFWCLLFWF